MFYFCAADQDCESDSILGGDSSRHRVCQSIRFRLRSRRRPSRIAPDSGRSRRL